MPFLSKRMAFFMGKYKRFGETRKDTVIIDTHVSMLWTSQNKNRYVALGYEFTKMGNEFLVTVSHLSPSSHKTVTTQCPICKNTKSTKYQDILKTGHTLCRGCACIKEMKGEKVGRLTFIDIDWNLSGDGVIWWKYTCDCGHVGSTRRSNVIAKNPTVSCGCYAKEVLKAQCGENHYNWNPNLTNEERTANRRSKKDKQWRKIIYERDQYTCQVCGDNRGGNLEAHHLYSYTAYPEHRIDVNNGITLCIKCHEDFHYGFMGHAADPCTPDDFQRWLFVREYG